MKQVIAIVKPYLAEKVLDALRPTPVEACAVREVKVIRVGVSPALLSLHTGRSRHSSRRDPRQ